MEVTVKLKKPHLHQQPVLEAYKKYRYIILQCGRRAGKSVMVQRIAIKEMINNKASVAYVTPTYDLSKQMFLEILSSIPLELIKSANKSDYTIELVTGGKLKFITGERLDNFRGHKFHLCIIDEAAFIKDFEDAWLNAIRPTLVDYSGKAIFASTPKGKGYFHSLYLKGLDDNEPDYKSFTFSTFDNPHLPETEKEEILRNYPQSVINQEYYAIAGENSDNPFGTDAINRNVISVTNDITRAQILGIDISSGMNDYTVVTGFDGNYKMVYFDKWKQAYPITKEKILTLPHNILKVIDATGGGKYVAQDIIPVLPNTIGFDYGGDRKAKLMLNLITKVQKDEVKYNKECADEMSVFEYSINQKTQHISYNAMAGFHDDILNSVALSVYHLPQSTASMFDRFSVV